MILNQRRRWLTDDSTVSDLYVDDRWFSFILEDRVREGEKVPGKTAIPEGWYEIVINWSDRFRRLMPLLLNVPGFTGIRYHPGNRSVDTLGCLLPGFTKGDDFVGQSAAAFDQLFAKISEAVKTGKVFTNISTASDVEDRRWMRI